MISMLNSDYPLPEETETDFDFRTALKTSPDDDLPDVLSEQLKIMQDAITELATRESTRHLEPVAALETTTAMLEVHTGELREHLAAARHLACGPLESFGVGVAQSLQVSKTFGGKCRAWWQATTAVLFHRLW